MVTKKKKKTLLAVTKILQEFSVPELLVSPSGTQWSRVTLFQLLGILPEPGGCFNIIYNLTLLSRQELACPILYLSVGQ